MVVVVKGGRKRGVEGRPREDALEDRLFVTDSDRSSGAHGS